MDWNKMGAVGSLLGGIFAVLVFALQIWPWPQIKKKKTEEAGQTVLPSQKTPRLIVVPLILSLGMSALAIHGAWHSTTIGNCKTVLQGWGWFPPKIMVQLDTDVLKDYDTTSHLVFIGRPSDHTVDVKQDKNIFKSGLFGINGGILPIETVTTEENQKRILQNGGWVELHVLLVPKEVTTDQITTLADAERLGGKEIEFRNYMLPVAYVAVPSGQKPPSGPGVY